MGSVTPIARVDNRRASALVVVGAAMAGVGLLLILFAAQSAAASPTPAGCPDGYHWDRMSGVGCVQTTLPPHGQYSYTSAAICNEGYVGVHASGPNAFGNDPNASYLVACLTPAEAAASAAAANATPVPGDGGAGNDADDMLGSGPLDQLAGTLAEKGTVPPTPSDADLGGLAATGLLLLSAGGATVLTGSAGGLAALGGGAAGGGAGAGGGGGGGGAPPAAGHGSGAAQIATAAGHGSAGAAGTGDLFGGVAAGAPAVGGLTTAAGSGLPLPRAELVAAGLSIFRSMKRVTSEADPSGYSAGDVAQLIGDASAIGALASILAPAANLLLVATAGAAAGAENASPQEVLERLRRSFGQLGYMQGILDENVDRADGKLAGLDGAPEGEAARAAPKVPSDPTALSDKQLREARAAWAARADVEFDALIAAQEDMSDLDDRRRNLGHQIDAVNELLARLDEAGTTPVPPHLADILRYGLGWYRAGDPDRMAEALRQSRSQARAAAKAAGQAGPAAAQPATAPPAASPPPSGGTPFAQWAAANGFEKGRVSILEALAGLERWCGFYDALTGTLLGQIATLRIQADTASATRRALSAEIQHRTLEGGRR